MISWMLHPGISVFLGGTIAIQPHTDTLCFTSCLMMARNCLRASVRTLPYACATVLLADPFSRAVMKLSAVDIQFPSS